MECLGGTAGGAVSLPVELADIKESLLDLVGLAGRSSSVTARELRDWFHNKLELLVEFSGIDLNIIYMLKVNLASNCTITY
jgi:hypothetical protein